MTQASLKLLEIFRFHKYFTKKLGPVTRHFCEQLDPNEKSTAVAQESTKNARFASPSRGASMAADFKSKASAIVK
jgi:hypothetical protein